MVSDMWPGCRQQAGVGPVPLAWPETSEAVAGHLGSLWWNLKHFLAYPPLL